MNSLRIPLGPSGKPKGWTTIDLEDYERLVIHRWYLSGNGYAFRTSGGKSVFMHREVLGFPESEDINHINGDRLDNRRGNLEPCTHRHNALVGERATVFPLRERIRALRAAGWHLQPIADELGVSVTSVAKYTHGLEKPPHPGLIWSRERLVEVVQQFHADHGRLPRGVDFNGQNGLPWFPQVYHRFPGGMSELREAAGFGRVDLRQAPA